MIRAPGSLVDTVLSCVATAIALALAVSGVVSVAASSARVSARAAVLADVARLDALLVEQAGRIVQPDASGSGSGAINPAQRHGSLLRISHLDGEPARELVVSWAEDLVIDAGGVTHRFTSLSVVSADLVRDPVALLRIVVRGRGSRWTLSAPLGGIDLP